jgi:hypothetical protein
VAFNKIKWYNECCFVDKLKKAKMIKITALRTLTATALLVCSSLSFAATADPATAYAAPASGTTPQPAPTVIAADAPAETPAQAETTEDAEPDCAQ